MLTKLAEGFGGSRASLEKEYTIMYNQILNFSVDNWYVFQLNESKTEL